MREKTSALHSGYVIDGVRQELTPAQMLGIPAEEGCAAIVDESIDPGVVGDASMPMSQAAADSRRSLTSAIVDTLWLDGRFRIGNLACLPTWHWNEERMGNMAAFFASVESLADAADSLGVALSGCSYDGGCETCGLSVEMSAGNAADEEAELPFRLDGACMGKGRICPDKAEPDLHSWLVYVPFTAEWGQFDADYFIDCHELVRELVEDGVIISGCSAGPEGLEDTLAGYVGDAGAVVRIAGIIRHFAVPDVRILRENVPGVLFQIRDIDYDYIDAEFLLQDVAYFPLGHPSGGGLVIDRTDKSGIQSILESLMESRSSEGED